MQQLLDLRFPQAIPPGTKVTATYRKQHGHTGTVLAINDPQAWHKTMAFGWHVEELPDQEAVNKHIETCLFTGYDKVPVKWSFGKIYFESIESLIVLDS